MKRRKKKWRERKMRRKRKKREKVGDGRWRDYWNLEVFLIRWEALGWGQITTVAIYLS